MNISFSLIKYTQYPNPAFSHSWTSLHPPISWFQTANTIATSIVHSKLDYCNSLYYNLPYYQLNRLQQIQNCLDRSVFKAPKFTHTTAILKSLHWLKINQRIEYKIKFFLLHKFLLLLKLATSKIWSLLTHLILKLVLLLLLPSLDHRHLPL